MKKDYTVVIGLEVHVELKTESKLFCSCRNRFESEPNENSCPACAGMPGLLPKLNRRALEFAVRAGLAMEGKINEVCTFDRKHYFYPDLPASFQTTQNVTPIVTGGRLDLEADGQPFSVRIHHIHLEEDAGKLSHASGSGSLADFNRVAVPLIEIVTEPDMRSAEQVRVFLESLRSLIQTIGVSDCKMQEGSLRCDVNISVQKKEDMEFGVRTEMKNINSFRAAVRAVEYESKRHIQKIEKGESVLRQTRRWDDDEGKSYAMRTKEMANDYRYIPEPNLPPVFISQKEIAEIRKSLPELPVARKRRYIEQFELSEPNADLLANSFVLGNMFDEAQNLCGNPKAVCNWIISDVLRLVKEHGIEQDDMKLSPQQLASAIMLVDKGIVNVTVGKKVLEDVFDNGGDPEAIVKEQGLAQISDEGTILEIVKEIIRNNPQSVADYKGGNEKALAFFVGQTMKATKGKANPKMVNEMVLDEINRS